MSSHKYVGVDIGGTKIHIGVVENEQLTKQIRLTTSASAPQEQILRELVAAITLVMDDEVSGIGIGAPGLVDEENGIVLNVQNILSWQEVPLRAYLARHFSPPIYLTNDANAFAIGEKIYGQGKQFANLVGITLGTGFGTGIIINHDVYSGTLSSAGEFGSTPYLDKTIEDYCSGKFFLSHYQQPGPALQVLAQAGDPRALEAFARYGEHLGSAIKTILYALSPQAIFLGGAVSNCYPLFQLALKASIAEFPFQKVAERLVVAPSALSNAAVLGAAALCCIKQNKFTSKVFS